MSLSVAPKIWTFFIKLDVCYEQLNIVVYMWALNNEKLDMYNLSEFQSPRIWTWLYTKKIVVWVHHQWCGFNLNYFMLMANYKLLVRFSKYIFSEYICIPQQNSNPKYSYIVEWEQKRSIKHRDLEPSILGQYKHGNISTESPTRTAKKNSIGLA